MRSSSKEAYKDRMSEINQRKKPRGVRKGKRKGGCRQVMRKVSVENVEHGRGK